jgi:hypothetical protein
MDPLFVQDRVVVAETPIQQSQPAPDLVPIQAPVLQPQTFLAMKWLKIYINEELRKILRNPQLVIKNSNILFQTETQPNQQQQIEQQFDPHFVKHDKMENIQIHNSGVTNSEIPKKVKSSKMTTWNKYLRLKATTEIKKVYVRRNKKAIFSMKTSKDASSALVEERARFDAARTHCANVLIFGRKGLPNDVSVTARDQLTIREPIVVDRNDVQATLPVVLATSSGLEIVSWKPVHDALALQLWPEIVQSWRQARTWAANVSAPLVIILGGPSDSGPSQSAFQMGQNQPSPPSTKGHKHRRSAVKKKLSLPTVASASSSSTPLTQSSVRRSTRLTDKEGFRTVRLEHEPSKKRNITGVVMVDEATGQVGPVPISVLQGWGIKCGVAPGELTEEALLQAPANQVTNDNPDA